MIVAPKLTVQEVATPLWMRLRDYMADKLDDLREQNDAGGLNEIQTAMLRGRIACLKELIALENQPPLYSDGNTNPFTATRMGQE